jgi:hypothetical protein
MPAEPTDRERDLSVLRNMIEEAHMLLDIDLPQGRATRSRELLTTALALTDDLITTSPAAALGKRGGMKTAQRGSEYFKEIAAKRIVKRGGRKPAGG